jgi:hypothetical protein
MRRSHEAGAVLLLAVVGLVLILAIGVALLQRTAQSVGTASREHTSAVALDLAEAGQEMAVCKLYQGYDRINEQLAATGVYGPDQMVLPTGTVTFTCKAPYEGIADTVEVVSQATSGRGRAEVRTVLTRITDIDAVFRGAIFSNQPLSLRGGGAVYADPATGEGGSIYANGDITFRGGSFEMEDEPGAAVPGDYNVYTTGESNKTPDGATLYEQVTPIPMPVVDLGYYETHATSIINGDLSLSGSRTLSGITYVRGDVRVTGNFNYTGVGTIVAEGSIFIAGNVMAGDPTHDSCVLITTRAITIQGSPTIYGLIYGHDAEIGSHVSVGGNPTIYGAIVADQVSGNGSIEVHYRDVWEGVQLPGGDARQVKRISWQRMY